MLLKRGRVAFGGEVVIIAVVLLGIRLVHDVPFTGSRGVDWVGRTCTVNGNLAAAVDSETPDQGVCDGDNSVDRASLTLR